MITKSQQGQVPAGLLQPVDKSLPLPSQQGGHHRLVDLLGQSPLTDDQPAWSSSCQQSAAALPKTSNLIRLNLKKASKLEATNYNHHLGQAGSQPQIETCWKENWLKQVGLLWSKHLQKRLD